MDSSPLSHCRFVVVDFRIAKPSVVTWLIIFLLATTAASSIPRADRVPSAHGTADLDRNHTEAFRAFLTSSSHRSGRLWSPNLERTVEEEPSASSGPQQRSENLRVRNLDTAADPMESRGSVMPIDSAALDLADMLRVKCNSGFMVVTVDRAPFNARFEVSSAEQIRFRDSTDPSCRATAKASNSTHYVLATMYNLCQSHLITSISANRESSIVSVENQIIIRGRRRSATNETAPVIAAEESDFIVNVTCAIETSSMQAKSINVQVALTQIEEFQNPSIAGNQTFVFSLFDRPWTSEEHVPVSFPYRVAVGQRLYAQVQPSPTLTDLDLKAHTMECYFTPFLGMQAEARQVLIKDGCGASSSVMLAHIKALPAGRYSRFSFELDRTYVDAPLLYLQCKVVTCSIGGSREVEGYDKCPISTACSNGTSSTPDGPRPLFYRHPNQYVHSGLIQPYVKPIDGVARDPSCPPCPIFESLPSNIANEKHRQEPETVIINGVSMAAVIGIAFGSFVFGIVFMAVLCFVHYRTQPKRYLNTDRFNPDSHHEDQESTTGTTQASTSSAAVPRPTACPLLPAA